MAKVLIVEDEPDVRRVLRLALEMARFKVLEASTGEEGLMITSAAGPDLIILDIMLPRMSGAEVLSRLRKASDTSAIPVIIITASQQAKESLSWEVGSANAFGKPFDPSTIVYRVEEILGKQS